MWCYLRDHCCDVQEAPKSKYIQEMLRKAQDRERLNARVYERYTIGALARYHSAFLTRTYCCWCRRLRKEREEDEHLYGDKEKFVTSAYVQFGWSRLHVPF